MAITLLLLIVPKVIKITRIQTSTESIKREKDGAKNLLVYDGSGVKFGSDKYSIYCCDDGKIKVVGNDKDYANLPLCEIELEPGHYSFCADFNGIAGSTVVRLWWINKDGSTGENATDPLNCSGERTFEVTEPCGVRVAVQAANGYTNCTVRPALFKND